MRSIVRAHYRQVTAWLWECDICQKTGHRLTQDGAKAQAREHHKEFHAGKKSARMKDANS